MRRNNRITAGINCNSNIIDFTVPVLALSADIAVFGENLIFTECYHIIGIQFQILLDSIHSHSGSPA